LTPHAYTIHLIPYILSIYRPLAETYRPPGESVRSSVRRGISTLILLLIALATLSWWLTHSTKPLPSAKNPANYPKNWGPIRAMTANIRMDDPKDGKNGWIYRRELLLKTFLKYQPDILACQEVAPAQGAYLNRELATWYAHYPRAGIGSSTTNSGSRSTSSQLLGVFGDVIASINTIYYRSDRFDILDGQAGLVLPNEPQPDASSNTFFTLAVLRERRNQNPTETAPGTLLVVDVHFRHDEPFAVRCAASLHDIIAQWQTRYPHSPVLLLGDINFDRNSKLYAALTPPLNKLLDPFDYSKMPPGRNGTFQNFTGKPSADWPTDLLFYGGNLTVITPAEILRDQAPDGRFPSDHYPVQAAFGW
jgi:endonuclease/exonuclease/phosphatase family metal-dependent hydrolase